MHRSIRYLAATLTASLAVMLVLVGSSQTVSGESPDFAKATGSLTVKIKPLQARREGARWRVDNGLWKKSGDIVSGLSVGRHKVRFKAIDDWYTPEQEDVSVRRRQTTELTVNYEAIEPVTIMLPGDVPLDFVWIPAGSFMMGRTTSRRTGDFEQDSLPNESPRHQVTFANGFLMGKYEVTQAQWLAVMGSNPSHFTGNPSRPVEMVSWNDVQTFIMGVNALGQGTFHLPSEAQWEYACRAGTTTRFYWGNDPNYTQIGSYAWYENNSTASHPVGQKHSNEWGLYDMSGNIFEWCEDWFHSSYAGAPADGSAWVSPTGASRVLRGGGWIYEAYGARSAFRGSGTPSGSFYTIGFRLAGLIGPTAAFSAVPTTGPAPLDVQFSDESTPGSLPITSWEWDFNNDGVVDSTEQHPQATFEDTGLYDVKLTVGAAAGSDSSITKNDYINVSAGNTSTIMLPGDVPLELVWIPAGSFQMGRYEDEQDSLDIEDPQHQVTFADGFWMGKYEVTQAQWLAVMGSNPSHFTGDLNRPVDKVSWDDVQTFITAVNALGQGTVHLPSEAQWEYACRAGTATRLFWGDDLGYTEIGTYAWYTGNSASTTHPVGQKTPNAFGLYDMPGNLWEWCEDYYHSSYTGAPTDGSAWLSPTTSARVIRGGSWDSTGVNCRSAFRSYSIPSSAFNDIGFRLAG